MLAQHKEVQTDFPVGMLEDYVLTNRRRITKLLKLPPGKVLPSAQHLKRNAQEKHWPYDCAGTKRFNSVEQIFPNKDCDAKYSSNGSENVTTSAKGCNTVRKHFVSCLKILCLVAELLRLHMRYPKQSHRNEADIEMI